MKTVYIAGAFTAADKYEIGCNILRAERVAAELIIHEKCAVLVPHSLGRSFVEGPGGPDYWYEATLALCLQCDALLTVDDWEDSKGTQREVAKMRSLGKPVFHSVEECLAWLEVDRG